MKTRVAVLLSILFSLLFYVSPARADGFLYEEGANTIELFDEPCKAPAVLKLLKPDFRAKYRRAAVTWDGKSYEACWLPFPDEHIVYLIDETGEHGPVPQAAFKKKSVGS